MNILLVTNLFPTPEDPERGIFTLQLVKKLQELGKVTVICPLPWFPKAKIFSGLKKWYAFSQVPKVYEMEGVTVYSPKYVMLPKVSESWHAFFMGLGLKRCIQQLHQEKHFDVVNSQWFYPDSVAVDRAIRTLNIPHIATGLGCDVNHDLFDSKKRPQLQQMLENVAAITVVSNELKKVLMDDSIPENKITPIPNGVDTSKFSLLDMTECRNKLDIEKSETIILYVGRLSEEKNVESLIRAFHQLELDETLKLYLVGDGPMEDVLKSLVHDFKLKDRVIFVGKVEHSQVSTWMGATNYFCLPSIREGCPNVVLEALGCGRPVIASHVGAIPDLVNDESGVLFDPNSISDIKSCLDVGLSKQWNYSVIAKSVKFLSWEHAAAHYMKVFHSVLKNS